MKTVAQLVYMRSPKGVVTAILPSRVYARMTEGWNIVDKAQQSYYSAQVKRISASLVVHSH